MLQDHLYTRACFSSSTLSRSAFYPSISENLVDKSTTRSQTLRGRHRHHQTQPSLHPILSTWGNLAKEGFSVRCNYGCPRRRRGMRAGWCVPAFPDRGTPPTTIPRTHLIISPGAVPECHLALGEGLVFKYRALDYRIEWTIVRRGHGYRVGQNCSDLCTSKKLEILLRFSGPTC